MEARCNLNKLKGGSIIYLFISKRKKENVTEKKKYGEGGGQENGDVVHMVANGMTRTRYQTTPGINTIHSDRFSSTVQFHNRV